MKDRDILAENVDQSLAAYRESLLVRLDTIEHLQALRTVSADTARKALAAGAVACREALGLVEQYRGVIETARELDARYQAEHQLLMDIAEKAGLPVERVARH
jgi:hypothetical protein